MTERLCRWGIMGTAGIARKNWRAIWNSGNSRLVAVASRGTERAQQFIQECQSQVPFSPAPVPVEGYEALLKRDDIDAVYIPLPTGIRKEWVIKAAEAGKHVLVEKPVGVTAADVAEINAACRDSKVQCMDGVMFMHSARMQRLREVLNDGQSVGRLRRISSHFSFNAPEEFLQSNIRVSNELEPLGCLGDLGWYNVRFTLWVMNYRLPFRVTGRMLSDIRRGGKDSAVPMEFSGELFFSDGVSASFYCSFLTENQQFAQISGTKGYITVPDFVLPFFGAESAFQVSNHLFDTRGCDFNMAEHTRRVAVPEYSNGAPDSQETNLFRNFANLVLGGKSDSHWPDIALKTQQVLDACLKSAEQDGLPVEITS